MALVTGASSGIGRATAIELSMEGARVAVVARRDELLESLATGIDARAPSHAVLIAVELLDPTAVASINAALKAHALQTDSLVNNVGGSRPLAADAREAAWTEPMDLNYTVGRRQIQTLLPAMRSVTCSRPLRRFPSMRKKISALGSTPHQRFSTIHS